MMDVRGVGFKEENVGKHIAGTKKKRTWFLEIGGETHAIMFYYSRLSDKRKIIADETIILNEKVKSDGKFDYSFIALGMQCSITERHDGFHLRVNSVDFAYLDKTPVKSNPELICKSPATNDTSSPDKEKDSKDKKDKKDKKSKSKEKEKDSKKKDKKDKDSKKKKSKSDSSDSEEEKDKDLKESKNAGEWDLSKAKPIKGENGKSIKGKDVADDFGSFDQHSPAIQDKKLNCKKENTDSTTLTAIPTIIPQNIPKGAKVETKAEPLKDTISGFGDFGKKGSFEEAKPDPFAGFGGFEQRPAACSVGKVPANNFNFDGFFEQKPAQPSPAPAQTQPQPQVEAPKPTVTGFEGFAFDQPTAQPVQAPAPVEAPKPAPAAQSIDLLGFDDAPTTTTYAAPAQQVMQISNLAAPQTTSPQQPQNELLRVFEEKKPERVVNASASLLGAYGQAQPQVVPQQPQQNMMGGMMNFMQPTMQTGQVPMMMVPQQPMMMGQQMIPQNGMPMMYGYAPMMVPQQQGFMAMPTKLAS